MCGAVAPIGDLFKLDVFELARRDLRIPRSIVEAPPSAELGRTSATMTACPLMSASTSLNALIVEAYAPRASCGDGFGADEVAQVVQLVDRSNSSAGRRARAAREAKAFGMGRRQPLAWRRGY